VRLPQLPQHGQLSSASFPENEMLEEIASSRFGFWVVALIMVAIDSSFLLRPGKFAFSISPSDHVRMRISPSPFLILNKELVCSLISFPFQLFFISDVESSERATGRETFKALSRLKRVCRQTAVFSVVAAIGIALLMLGPCLAAVRSVQTSIVLILPPFYLLAVATSVLLWQRRRKVSLSENAVLKISAEIILCPVLLVNIAKRISLAQRLELNSYRLALLSNSPGQTLAAIRENIQFHNGG
jgi:hypothetical protein